MSRSRVYARAFGGHGVTVERTADFPDAFRAALATGKPAIIRLLTDSEAIAPGTTLSKIRAASLARGGWGDGRSVSIGDHV
jgi:acetolactate synthase-1/2/3 large subunit